jgi:hypothetical protein
MRDYVYLVAAFALYALIVLALAFPPYVVGIVLLGFLWLYVVAVADRATAYRAPPSPGPVPPMPRRSPPHPLDAGPVRYVPIPGHTRRNLLAPRPSARRHGGYKLVAALISAGILLGAIGLSARGYVSGAKALRHAQYVTVASGIAEAQIERLRARPEQGALGSRPLPARELSALPGGSGRIRVAPYDSPGLRVVEVRVEWDEPPEGPRSVELTSLLPVGPEPAPGGGRP